MKADKYYGAAARLREGLGEGRAAVMATPTNKQLQLMLKDWEKYGQQITEAFMLPASMLIQLRPNADTELKTRKCSSCGVRYFSLAGWFDWQCSDCRPGG